MEKRKRIPKRQYAILYKTDGKQEKILPGNGRKFDYRELQTLVGGNIESLISANPNCRQMYCNEDGMMHGLPPNPQTWNVVRASVYKLNGYGQDWRVLGNIVAVLTEPLEVKHGDKVNNPDQNQEAS